MTLAQASLLIVGVGGLGCPALAALADAGVGRFILVDDDSVELSNLHRQLLFDASDVGTHKLDAACARLSRHPLKPSIELRRTRLLPDNARELVREADVIVEGADNFATKFLAADSCHLEGKPVVHGAAVRWQATAWAVRAEGRPCYRCLFEDLPSDEAAPNCAEAGVMGPVAGFAGSLMAELALRALSGDADAYEHIFTYDGQRDQLRSVPVRARASCPLCGPKATIGSITESRYTSPACSA